MFYPGQCVKVESELGFKQERATSYVCHGQRRQGGVGEGVDACVQHCAELHMRNKEEVPSVNLV